MWRSIVPSILAILFTLNLLVHGDISTRRFVVAVYVVVGSLVAAAWWASTRPEHPVARVLLKTRGPLTAGPIVTKTEGYQAAWSYLRFGAVSLALLVLIFYLLESIHSARAQTLLLVMLAFTVLPAGMGLLGGVYLLIRTTLRSTDV